MSNAWIGRLVCLTGAMALAVQTAQAAGAPAGDHWPMVEQYCVGCHNTTDWAGELALDAVDHAHSAIPGEAETWEKVIKRLRGRLMPPPGEERPSTEQLDSFVHWLEGAIDETAARHPEAGYVPLHRLNRREYTNSVRDLLDLEFDPSSLLPQDDLSDGFDNVAKVLQVSPTFLDQYLAAARTVAVQAIGNPASRPVGTPYNNPFGGPQHVHVEGLPFGTRGGFGADHIFPADGEYELNINNMARALWVEGMEFENQLVALVDGVKVYEVTIGGDTDQKAIDQKGDAPVDAINQRLKNIRFQAKAGQHRVVVTFRARSYAESDSRLALLVPGGGEDRVLKVTNFEVRGPFKTDGVSQSASRRRVFSCYPRSLDEEKACAEQITASIARKAFRRPLREGEVANLMQAYASARQGRGFDDGIRSVVTRILASPDFLYRPEPAPAGKRPGDVYALDDLQLASRLSFFLWSSLPDDELLEVAASGRLADDAVLEKQVRRMLADPRAQSLARDFAFQWLGLSKLADIEPDPAIFPYAANHRDLEGDLREDFREEIRQFTDAVFRGNRTVLELMTGNYTYLNERLAVHYGIRDVKGSSFRRVTLADPNRFGLLGKAGVLMVSSYPNRTSPVLRGAWILDNITGTPPTPPPPNVESLKEAPTGAKVLSMREQMAVHRTNKSCFACHGVLDPMGLALENFDGVGRWREKDRLAETRIDASGVLPDGHAVSGPVDLRNALMKNPDQFVQTLTTKLMIYAAGRPMEWQDMPTIRGIVKKAAADDYRFATLVTLIVKSAPFRMKQIPVESKVPETRQASLIN
jgi:Protein of unknown function (DUF1592)/Protein of unknown function (DUF1588)/Protein of unknown function (DUF1587)/Protein of unknown function (DUF1585)/Protein of unknown function (DUF1595)/Planctomycete cytochrome C